MLITNDLIRTKKKIIWVTPDYFVDCDFNIEILRTILEDFDIFWIILLPHKNARFSIKDFEQLSNLNGLKIEFQYSKSRQRDPRRTFFYLKIFRTAMVLKPDLIFLNCVPDPFLLPTLWLLNKKKTIISAHDGEVNGGFDFKLVTKISFNLSYRFFRNVCMYSPSQASIFKRRFPNANVSILNLALKSFGISRTDKSEDVITFLSFGVINYSKNIELLIEAACNIYEKGYRNFLVSINGRCDCREYYQLKMRYPEIFVCNFKIIENTNIPDLFAAAHYFVQPYRHMSQSGAMKVAFNYNVPVIASNLPGFRDEVINGVNGFLFENENVQDLERVMMEVIDNHSCHYDSLISKMKRHTAANYSAMVIAGQYLKMFNGLANA